jgi:hypothetical protein
MTISSFVDRMDDSLFPSGGEATRRKGSREQYGVRESKGRGTFLKYTWVDAVWTSGSTRVTGGEQFFDYIDREMYRCEETMFG